MHLQTLDICSVMQLASQAMVWRVQIPEDGCLDLDLKCRAVYCELAQITDT